MAEGDVFRHGVVQYPLAASTANALLKDADPALFHALDFFAAMLRRYIGSRLAAQALAVNTRIADAVAQVLHVEPSPFLLANQLVFPTLAIHRRAEANVRGSTSYMREVSEWEFAYVLPSLNPHQLAALNPILRAASRVLTQVAEKGRDPSYNAGASVWELAGIESARVTRSTYGFYEPIEETGPLFRALLGTLEVVELDKPIDDTFDLLTGVTGHFPVGAPDGTETEDIAVVATWLAPTIASVVPSLGTKVGGTNITITGTGFREDTQMRVLIGGADCTGVEVLDATHVRAVTPAHDAYPTFDADVTVIAADTQQATLPLGFSFTTP